MYLMHIFSVILSLSVISYEAGICRHPQTRQWRTPVSLNIKTKEQVNNVMAYAIIFCPPGLLLFN